MIVEAIAYPLAGLCIIAAVWKNTRKRILKRRPQMASFKALRGSACLLKDYSGIFGYSAPLKMGTETNNGAVQDSEERFYFRVQHGKKGSIYRAYSGELVSASQLEDLELNDASAITPVWVKWEGR